jgi:CubicO group peptidase (beta-lactamase class C family)
MNIWRITVITTIIFFSIKGVSAQSLNINDSYYDSLHQYLVTTNLTHYRIYFQDSLAYRWRDPDCDNDTINTASLMKSITSIAIGELLENGFINSLEDKVCNYIPEWQAGCEKDVTIRHLITMTSGILKKPASERIKFFTTNDWNSFVLNMSLDTLPGLKWSYSNEGGQLLEPIIGRASNMDVQAFFDKYVFIPLEMNNTRLFQDSTGNYSTIGGASTHIDDLSNLGLAVLNGGKYHKKQIIDPDYLKSALTPIAQNPYYGFLWWVDQENKTYTAMGDGGTMIIIYPEKDLVFVRSNNCKTGRDPMAWMGPSFVKSIGELVQVR